MLKILALFNMLSVQPEAALLLRAAAAAAAAAITLSR
jgi:hypothetical protein